MIFELFCFVLFSSKLRRGDPFTSHYCTTDKIDIFKSPKSKGETNSWLNDASDMLKHFIYLFFFLNLQTETN